MIGDIMDSRRKRPQHLLVFVNPFGGKGRGKQLWEENISEVFKIAGIVCKVKSCISGFIYTFCAQDLKTNLGLPFSPEKLFTDNGTFN